MPRHELPINTYTARKAQRVPRPILLPREAGLVRYPASTEERTGT